VTQNIYDDPGFFAAYGRLPRSRHGLDGAPEWPALRALVPDLRGRVVLDLGCGFGWFARWARSQGAARVLGLDVSARMLAHGRAMTEDPAVAFVRADLERLALAPAVFDLAWSALALHYVVDLGRLLAAVHAALRPGGRLVASVEHPIFTAPTHPGWQVDGTGRRVWPLDAYQNEGPRTTDWLAPGVIKQHRTVGTYVRLLRQAGLTLTHLEDWAPDAAQVAADPPLADERERPTFMLLAAVRG
jgi:SAM-dependent methyltransferase